MKVKQQRLNRLIVKHIAQIIQYELNDPDLGLVTISEAEVSADLSFCKVYVMISGNKRQKHRSLEALNHASGYIRSSLAKELMIRKTPEIKFYYDDTLDKAERIDELLALGNNQK